MSSRDGHPWMSETTMFPMEKMKKEGRGKIDPISQEKKAQQAIDKLLGIAQRMAFDPPSDSDNTALKSVILTDPSLGRKGESVFHELLIFPGPGFATSLGACWGKEAKCGKNLLGWMLSDREISTYASRKPAESSFLVLHRAIGQNHVGFMSSLFDIAEHPPLRSLNLRSNIGKLIQAVESDAEKANSIHYAIQTKHQYASYLVRLGSKASLMAKNHSGHTPLLLAMDTTPGKVTNVSMGGEYTRSRFEPIHVWEEIKLREDASELLPDLLKATNKKGDSAYSLRCNLNRFPDDIDNRDGELRKDLREKIFQHVKGITNVSLALYGSKGDDKELCLDMSDFNQSTHDFQKFIKRLIESDVAPDAGFGASPWRGLHFEETLFFVNLPDLNYVRLPRPNEWIRKLFKWIKDDKGVRTIRRLHLPDNTTSPLSEEFVKSAILDRFTINDLDWRKLDVNLNILSDSVIAEHIESLSLYSSGNWSVLYHWLSCDGLATLSKGIHEKETRDLHKALSNEYKARLEKMHCCGASDGTNPSLNWNFKLDVAIEAKWDYLVRQDQGGDEPVFLKHQLKAQLLPTMEALEFLESRNYDQLEPPFDDFCARFQDVITNSPPSEPDKRIKVAIIDNGVDGIRSSVKDMIARGISYVAAGPYTADQDQTLPWWMVADPHGTHMASLVGQINPYCRLYIARVGKGRSDIQVEHAIKAINWALDQDVDIISISWVKYKLHDNLKTAIEKACSIRTGSKRPALVFCSTADEGAYSGPVYPADHKGVLRVSATDEWGHLTSRATGLEGADIQIPGENVEADGPTYLRTQEKTVSGSSVATALAAGVASLALTMLETFNEVTKEERDYMHTRECMKMIFDKMDANKTGIQVKHLFPDPSIAEGQARINERRLTVLAKKWNKEQFWDPTSDKFRPTD